MGHVHNNGASIFIRGCSTRSTELPRDLGKSYPGINSISRLAVLLELSIQARMLQCIKMPARLRLRGSGLTAVLLTFSRSLLAGVLASSSVMLSYSASITAWISGLIAFRLQSSGFGLPSSVSVIPLPRLFYIFPVTDLVSSPTRNFLPGIALVSCEKGT